MYPAFGTGFRDTGKISAREKWGEDLGRGSTGMLGSPRAEAGGIRRYNGDQRLAQKVCDPILGRAVRSQVNSGYWGIMAHAFTLRALKRLRKENHCVRTESEPAGTRGVPG